MTTQEIKSYIDRILGNSIRCLLPSYWWKRVFGAVLGKVDEVEGKIPDTSNLAKTEYVDNKVAEVVTEVNSDINGVREDMANDKKDLMAYTDQAIATAIEDAITRQLNTLI